MYAEAISPAGGKPASTGETPSRWEHWSLPWVSAVAGGAGGVFDAVLAYSMGIEMTLGDANVAPYVLAFFGVTYAGLGYVGGGLIQAHARARRTEGVIAGQLRELQRTQRALIQQEKLAAIGRLAAGIAHEVRNPLGVIRASASMVQESFEPGEDPHRACEFICEEIDRLNGLIAALLSFARPSEPRCQSISLDDVVRRALDLASDSLRSHGVEAEHRPETTDRELSADPNLVSQVVYGLLSNALEALQAAGPPDRTQDSTGAARARPRIEIRTGVDAAGAYVEVADNGPGVADATAAQIFEPFFTTKDSGTGLGLPMGLRIAEAHGGSLCSVNGRGAGEQGQGACFRVDLPLEHPDAPRENATS